MTIITPKQLLHDILKMKLYNGVPEYALKSIEGIRRYMASWLKHTMILSLGGKTNGDRRTGSTASGTYEGKENRQETERRQHRL